jgi:putative protease
MGRQTVYLAVMGTFMSGVELLSPAGTLRNLEHALHFGADAVYAGMPRYSLRVRNNDFLGDNLARGIQATRAIGRKFFLACNLLPHGAKLKTFIEDLEPVMELAPDAVIMADPGLIMLARERWPELPIHISVQANTMNAASVEFWRRMGASRVILSRELSLDEVSAIRDDCPDMELEVFVHGALCIAYSGRCLLSGYFNHRDANQGSCTNSCRWDYKVSQTGQQRHPMADQPYQLEEAQRPGEFMPIEEDETGTYIMNSRDLRAVEHVHRLVGIGVDSLKIEGRTKSHYYVARATQVYRQAIDDALAGRPFRPELIGDLDGLANRGYTDGFYQRHETRELQNYRSNSSANNAEIFVGEILNGDPSDSTLVEVKNKFAVGDRLRLIQPEGNREFVLDELRDEQGRPVDEAKGSGYRVRVRLPARAAPLDLLTRVLPDSGITADGNSLARDALASVGSGREG